MGGNDRRRPRGAPAGSSTRTEGRQADRVRDAEAATDEPAHVEGPRPGAARIAAHSGGAERTRTPHWRRLLSGSRPREVLARLIHGDPLGVRALVARRLREHAYLMDADRVFLRVIARCARFSGRYRGQPPLEQWLLERVDEALGDLLDEELAPSPAQLAATAQQAEGAEPSGAHVELARPLGLDPARMRLACAAFNHADAPARRAFFSLVVEGRSLDELAGSSGSSATALARHARRVLELCLAAGAERSRT